MKSHHAVATVLALAIVACTPKVADTTTAEKQPQAQPTQPQLVGGAKLSSCPKFSDNPNADALTDDYVIYRDFIKTENYAQAYPLWQKVYAAAPAADGQRNTVFVDGITLMEQFMAEATDPDKKAEYRDRVFALYDELDKCYPEGGYVPARKGFDYFYKYPGAISKLDDYKLFQEAIARDSMEVGEFILNPMTSLLVELHQDGKISDEEARTTGRFILERLRKLEADAKTANDRERVRLIKGYVPDRMVYFEQVKGFYDCDYYKGKYLAELEATPDDCVLISQTIGYMRYGGCTSNDPDIARLTAKYNSDCRETVASSGCSANTLLQNGDYREAIDCLEDRYESTDESIKKAELALIIAKVYYGNLRNFSQARSWARKAAGDRGGWGEPYILIGKLYASSGPLCGTGTGFDSQRVVWAAMDQWVRARSVDPSAAREANRLIGQYTQYLPTKGDLFSRGLKEGQSYTVPCWIGESTTVRGI